jgi:hypothetical protein
MEKSGLAEGITRLLLNIPFPHYMLPGVVFLGSQLVRYLFYFIKYYCHK